MMDSSNLCEIGYFDMRVSGIVLYGILSVFSHTF